MFGPDVSLQEKKLTVIQLKRLNTANILQKLQTNQAASTYMLRSFPEETGGDHVWTHVRKDTCYQSWATALRNNVGITTHKLREINLKTNRKKQKKWQSAKRFLSYFQPLLRFPLLFQIIVFSSSNPLLLSPHIQISRSLSLLSVSGPRIYRSIHLSPAEKD